DSSDFEFFEHCLALASGTDSSLAPARRERRMPVVLGVYRAMAGSREQWLGSRRYAALAATIGQTAMVRDRLIRNVRMGHEPLGAMAERLAIHWPDSLRAQPPWYLTNVVEESHVEASNGDSLEVYVADFSRIDSFGVIGFHELRDHPSSIGDHIVLV